MKDSLKKFVKLRKSLEAEKAQIESRLAEVIVALGGEAEVSAPMVKERKKRKKSKMSAEGKAKIAAAQKARWAKFHAEKKK